MYIDMYIIDSIYDTSNNNSNYNHNHNRNRNRLNNNNNSSNNQYTPYSIINRIIPLYLPNASKVGSNRKLEPVAAPMLTPFLFNGITVEIASNIVCRVNVFVVTSTCWLFKQSRNR